MKFGISFNSVLKRKVGSGDFRPSDDPDSWSSDFVYNDQFSVAAIRDLIDKPVSPSPSSSVLWVNELEGKACFSNNLLWGDLVNMEGKKRSNIRQQIDTGEHSNWGYPIHGILMDPMEE
ncbi:hypothetical protein L2E82_09202 [Cichorium intybus]|uniref:Uncharacterized protein n=1 Tax=Cichorium intybus TaxID=13427 RepID=A0ACB9G8D4_CICIN|nr:hypothetical protein L2E82_09202 [Cichorium intybus]